MPGIKELVVILVLATVTFRLAKPIALQFSSESDFCRRRNLWLVLTAAGLLSPNFWLFALLAVPLLYWGQRKDTNPVAFYLALLQVIPPVNIDIPIVGINQLFPLNIYRLLAVCVLVPAALRYRRRRQPGSAAPGFGTLDVLLIGYGLLTTVLYVPPDLPNHVILPDSFTNLLRRGFLFLLDVYVIYFAVDRTCSSRGAIADALAAYCISCALLAPIAIFETANSWLLYVDMAVRWTGDPGWGFYTMRGTTLRAMASTGGPISLGFMLALAFGFWLYLGSHVKSRWTRGAVISLYVLGMLAAYSRGPWTGALAIYLVFAAIGPGAFRRVFKAVAVLAIAVGGLLASPLGDRMISVIPFMGGSVDSSTIRYREHLAERSWELIKENPFLGDQLAMQKMEDLRQGMGIIDLVNTYANVALFYGLVGLFLFAGFILLGLRRDHQLAKLVAQSDPDLALLGATLVACIVGMLVMLASSSLYWQYAIMFYVLGGLAGAYARLGAPARTAAGSTAPGTSRE